MKQMKKGQRGFTLVELVVVVAVTGILAAVAIPKVTDVSDDARTAALVGAAGALSSAGKNNFAVHGVDDTKGIAVNNCATAELLLQGGLPDAYEVNVPSATVGSITYGDGTTELSNDNTGALPVFGHNDLATCPLSTTVTPILTTTFLAYGIGTE